ncbi:hypothetical protein GWK47_023760 [Chionoecetes opilio]|uniref:Uncharacterized protein n=1 Tax=Chionoecetes opilio TaxID=41210 RepID=A0A8J4XM76_CHIOP|nr:hypothetical protein GWK47_023760 [Chionoecetes opilio]
MTTSARSNGSILRGPSQVCCARHWMRKMLRDVLGSDPGTDVETLAVLCLRTTCIILKASYWGTIVDSSTGTAQAGGIHGFAEACGAYWSDRCPLCLTQRQHSGVHRELPSFWRQQLEQEGVSTWPAGHHF